MAKGDLTTTEIKRNAINKMLESLIADNAAEAGKHLHDFLTIKTREIILGEMDDDHDCEDDKESDDKDDKESDDKAKKSKKSADDDDDDDDDDKEKVDEQTRSSAFARSGSIMSDNIMAKIKFENGGKKTLKKHGNAPKELDDDKIGKTKFKSGGKNPMKTLEKTPKPNKFDDGREKELGTTKS